MLTGFSSLSIWHGLDDLYIYIYRERERERERVKKKKDRKFNKKVSVRDLLQLSVTRGGF